MGTTWAVVQSLGIVPCFLTELYTETLFPSFLSVSLARLPNDIPNSLIPNHMIDYDNLTCISSCKKPPAMCSSFSEKFTSTGSC